MVQLLLRVKSVVGHADEMFDSFPSIRPPPPFGVWHRPLWHIHRQTEPPDAAIYCCCCHFSIVRDVARFFRRWTLQSFLLATTILVALARFLCSFFIYSTCNHNSNLTVVICKESISSHSPLEFALWQRQHEQQKNTRNLLHFNEDLLSFLHFLME